MWVGLFTNLADTRPVEYGVRSMTTGRKLRLALGAAILAALFVFVSVGHLGVHAGSAPADPPCAMCGPASDVLVASVPDAPVFTATPILRSTAEAPLRLDIPLLPPSRGPPSRG